MSLVALVAHSFLKPNVEIILLHIIVIARQIIQHHHLRVQQQTIQTSGSQNRSGARKHRSLRKFDRQPIEALVLAAWIRRASLPHDCNYPSFSSSPVRPSSLRVVNIQPYIVYEHLPKNEQRLQDNCWIVPLFGSSAIAVTES